MKRILSIAISMLLISNIFGVALLADAAEETCHRHVFLTRQQFSKR